MPDKWTPCANLARVMDECRHGDVVFWKFNVAVSDVDVEAEMAKKHR